MRTLRAKMQEYIDRGAQLGWLADLETRTVEISRREREPEPLENADCVRGGGPVAGFVLNLRTIWDPLQ